MGGAGRGGVFVMAVIFSWNNFVVGIVLAGREARTLPVAVYNMISFDQLSWGPLAAAALIVTLPVLLLTVFAQRQIVAGLTAGAGQGGENVRVGRNRVAPPGLLGPDPRAVRAPQP